MKNISVLTTLLHKNKKLLFFSFKEKRQCYCFSCPLPAEDVFMASLGVGKIKAMLFCTVTSKIVLFMTEMNGEESCSQSQE